MKVEIGQVWQHYKGGMYTIISLPLNSDTDDLIPMVVYQDMSDKNNIWVQSQKRFLEHIEINGETVPRFTFISDNTTNA